MRTASTFLVIQTHTLPVTRGCRLVPRTPALATVPGDELSAAMVAVAEREEMAVERDDFETNSAPKLRERTLDDHVDHLLADPHVRGDELELHPLGVRADSVARFGVLFPREVAPRIEVVEPAPVSAAGRQ